MLIDSLKIINRTFWNILPSLAFMIGALGLTAATRDPDPVYLWVGGGGFSLLLALPAFYLAFMPDRAIGTFHGLQTMFNRPHQVSFDQPVTLGSPALQLSANEWQSLPLSERFFLIVLAGVGLILSVEIAKGTFWPPLWQSLQHLI